MRSLGLLLRVARPELPWMALGTAVGVVVALSVTGLMVVATELLVVCAVAGVAWTPAVHSLNAAIRAFAVLRTIGRYGERVFTHEATLRILARLRVWLFEGLVPLAPAGLARRRSGDLLERIVGDIDALTGFYVRVLSPSIVALSLVAIATTAAWLRSPTAALVLLGAAASLLLFLPVVAHLLGSRAQARLGRTARQLRTRWVETFAGVLELTLFGAVSRQLDALGEDGRARIAARAHVDRMQGALEAATSIVSGLGLVALIVALGRTGSASGLPPEGAPALVVGALVVLGLLAPVPLSFFELGRSQEGARRLAEVLETAPAAPPPERPAPLPRDFSLSVDRVSFAYEPRGAAALDEVSIELEAGASLAIVGATGSGKSTLVELLLRFRDPQEGAIRIGGTDLRRLDDAALRRLVTGVPQRPHLFEGSLRDNLRLGRAEATDEELKAALETARLGELPATLPRGLDHPVGAGGASLSAGQSRRVAIARALLREVPIIVLDEPTEGLDEPTARALVEGILSRERSATTIVVTHDLAVSSLTDRVALMEAGRIVELGSHEELLAAGGRYAHRWASEEVRRCALEGDGR